MALPDVVTRDEWLEARKRLLVQEKEATRQRDALNTQRRLLPMVRVDKQYLLDGPAGKVPLDTLFGDYRQLIVQHIMFDPAWDAPCPGCTASINATPDALFVHLRSRDTALVMVSRAPLDKLEKARASRGWTIPWYSSYGTDFNYDFAATLDSTRAQLDYNYRFAGDLLEDGETSAELPGLSCFLRDGGEVFHTYSTWARGTEGLVSAYILLDLTALGRQEEWEEPKGRAPRVHGADPTFRD